MFNCNETNSGILNIFFYLKWKTFDREIVLEMISVFIEWKMQQRNIEIKN